ncbi:MAG TPA: hypothetical protein VKO67_00950, partial [Smithellaceae bacterium]|nr:hypothetical protein [Smithellaceae bacterium]
MTTIKTSTPCPRRRGTFKRYIHYFLSTIHYSLFTTHYPLSTIHHLSMALLLLVITAAPVFAVSSVNVSLERDIYADMQLWAAEGLIPSELGSIRPFAASEVGNQLAAALDRCKAMKVPSASCRRIADYYAKLFSAEIAEAKSSD